MTFPEPITEAVSRIGAVDLAVTYPVPTTTDHEAAVTALTLRPGASVTAADLTDALASMPVGLPPDIVHVVPELPLSATFRPMAGVLSAAGLPKVGRQVWYHDPEDGRYKRLTATARTAIGGV